MLSIACRRFENGAFRYAPLHHQFRRTGYTDDGCRLPMIAALPCPENATGEIGQLQTKNSGCKDLPQDDWRVTRAERVELTLGATWEDTAMGARSSYYR